MGTIYMIRDVRTYSLYYARVSGNESAQEGYPFANCTAYRTKPWLEWRSGYSDQNAHQICINTDLPFFTAIAFFGCNFPSVTIDSVARPLTYNRITGDYRGTITGINVSQNEEMTIPAYSTGVGYFKCSAIVCGQASTVTSYNAVYPLDTTVLQNATDATLFSGRTIRNKLGDRKQTITVNLHPLSGGLIHQGFYSFMSTCLRDTPIAFYDNALTAEKTYYCRRINDFEATENAINDGTAQLVLREL